VKEEDNRTHEANPMVQFQAKQARREAQKAAKQDPILKKQIQDVSSSDPPGHPVADFFLAA
jgi:hypothetical protein